MATFLVRALALAGIAAGMFAHQAHAADPAANYPQRPVRVVSGSPGSTAGIVGAEIVAKRPRTAEQGPRLRGCDPVAGCQRRR